jgi:hypothetical protein
MRRLRPLLRLVGFGLATGLALLTLLIGITGNGGLTQYLLNGAERRARASRPTRADRLGLQLGGRVAYPQAAHLLAYYCAGQGDMLRFDAAPPRRAASTAAAPARYHVSTPGGGAVAVLRGGQNGLAAVLRLRFAFHPVHGAR